MSLLDEKEIQVLDENGETRIFKILFTYENEERKTNYVFFYDEKDPDEVMVKRYTLNGAEGELEEIEDEEEYNEVLEVFNAYQDDPEIQKLKEED